MFIIDALILCGGYAKRLEPITTYIPKPLLPIDGNLMIDHILEGLIPNNFNRIIVSTNKKFEKQFKYWIEHRKAVKNVHIDLVVEPTMHEGEKFGAIKGIEYTIKKLGLTDDLLIVAGDNFHNFDLSKLISKSANSGKIVTALHNIKDLEEAKRFGVVSLNGSIIAEFEEKPQNPKSTLISTCIYAIPKQHLAKFDEYIKNKNNPDSPGYFMQWLVKNKNEVHAVVYDDFWYDIGTPDSYKEVVEKHEGK